MSGSDAWSDVGAWMRHNGAFVHSSLRTQATRHGGISVRGVVSIADLPAHEPLLYIPRKLWFTLDKFPEIQNSQLPSSADISNVVLLKVAVALALEVKKGKASFFASYLSSLPALADFQSFHPTFSGEDIVSDFEELPAVGASRFVAQEDAATMTMFEEWQSVSGASSSCVPGLTALAWEEVLQGIAWFRTRAFLINASSHEAALIPGADFLNTARQSSLNTDWALPVSSARASSDSFTLRADIPVEAGVELFDRYCYKCDNDMMLSVWGLYLEDNPVRSTDIVDCSSSDIGARMRLASEGILDLDANSLVQSRAQGWTAPRCSATTGMKGQLRCSLARLAWEYCAEAWGYGLPAGSGNASPMVPPAAFHSKNAGVGATRNAISRSSRSEIIAYYSRMMRNAPA